MPAAILPIALEVIDLLQVLAPIIKKEFQGDPISIEDQQLALSAFNAMKANLHSYFTGPEWTVDPDTPPTTTEPVPVISTPEESKTEVIEAPTTPEVPPPSSSDPTSTGHSP